VNEYSTANRQPRGAVYEATVFDYVRVVARHWKFVALVCVPVVVATAIWSLVVTETFRARTSIVPPLDSMQGSNLGLARGFHSSAEGAFLNNALSATSVADIYVGILESRAMADTIVQRFDLAEVYGSADSPWKARERLRANTEIKVGKEGIVQVAVVDTDPVRAAAMANAYVEELDAQNKRLSGGQATSKRVFLEARLKEIEERFSRIESIPSHEAQVQEMLYELLIRESEIAKIEEAKSMPTIQVLDEAVPPEHKYQPVRRVMVMKAAVAAFALAVVLAFIFEYRERVKDTQSMERLSRSTPSRESKTEALEVEANKKNILVRL